MELYMYKLNSNKLDAYQREYDSSFMGVEIPCLTCSTLSQIIQDKLEIYIY